ncbi:MAG: beta-ketoacyl-ACP synthase III [Oscillospiraceae bacterium]
MTGIKILGTGCYLPDNIVSNDDFTRVIQTSDEWIRTRTGITSRHIANGETAWYMGLQSAKQALECANITPLDLDLIIVTSVSSDYLTPSLACIIQAELGASKAVAFDVNAACSGFVYAIDVASKYLQSDQYNHVLIVSTEALSNIVDFTNRSTCVLFGDGAGSCVLTKSDGIFSSYIGSDGTGANAITCKNIHKNNNPFTTDSPIICKTFDENADGFLEMQGKEVYKFAIKAMPDCILKVCEQAGVSHHDINLIIPHQANIRIMETAAKTLGLSMDEIYCNLDKYGNTSSASIPIALDELNKNGTIKPNDLIVMVGFGAGLTFGATLLKW